MEEKEPYIEKEVREGRISVQNVMAAYLIELVETRSVYISGIKKFGSGIPSPEYFRNFFIAFNKFYNFASNIIDTDDKESKELKESIDDWFDKVELTNHKQCVEGISLSIKFQRTVESENIFPLFEEPIEPPFLVEVKKND